MFQVRTTCRVCGSPFIPIIDLGMQRLTGWTKTPDEEGPEGPLSLVRCSNPPCSLVQLEHTMDADLMWRDADYGYRSGLNPIMVDALANIVKCVQRKVYLEDGDIVVDIGSNDGTLLRNYPRPSVIPVGFEPVKKFAEEGSRDIDYFINDYFSYEDYPFTQPAKAVTAIAMFYDLEEPDKFVSDVNAILDDEGVFVLQLNYLPIIMLQNDFLCICHEHLEYYTIESIEYLLARHGLHAFDAEINEINGGSLRLYVDRGQRTESFMLYVLREWEKRLQLTTEAPYQEFVDNIEGIREDLIEIVNNANDDGKIVCGYASSTKGNVLLQYCGFGPSDIMAISEKNPDKWDRYCAGSNIPVISEQEARELNPNYFLVLAWAFQDEFRRREKAWHDGGGQFILPVPQVAIE